MSVPTTDHTPQPGPGDLAETMRQIALSVLRREWLSGATVVRIERMNELLLGAPLPRPTVLRRVR